MLIYDCVNIVLLLLFINVLIYFVNLILLWHLILSPAGSHMDLLMFTRGIIFLVYQKITMRTGTKISIWGNLADSQKRLLKNPKKDVEVVNGDSGMQRDSSLALYRRRIAGSRLIFALIRNPLGSQC